MKWLFLSVIFSGFSFPLFSLGEMFAFVFPFRLHFLALMFWWLNDSIGIAGRTILYAFRLNSFPGRFACNRNQRSFRIVSRCVENAIVQCINTLATVYELQMHHICIWNVSISTGDEDKVHSQHSLWMVHIIFFLSMCVRVLCAGFGSVSVRTGRTRMNER